MKQHLLTALLCSLVHFSAVASAADKKPGQVRGRAPEQVVELTEAGKKLEAEYAGMLSALKAEIEQQLPQIDDSKKAACLEALQAEKAALDNAAAKAKAPFH